jgi:phosphate-selective porin
MLEHGTGLQTDIDQQKPRECILSQHQHPFARQTMAAAVLLALVGSVQAQGANKPKAANKELAALRAQVAELSQLARPNAELLKALQQEVAELKTRLGAASAGAAGTAAATAATTLASTGESVNKADPLSTSDEATRDAQTFATKADISGVRTDLENFKYDQTRSDERTRASTTRNTKITGTVGLRANWQNPAQNAGLANGATGGGTTFQARERQGGFEVGLATLNFTGNLFRDYKEGKNLTYSLGFSYGSNFAGSPNSATSANRTLGVASANGSQLNLTNASLAYSFFPTNGGQEDAKGALTFGQQLLPFGLEAQADEEVRPVINSAQFTSALSGINARQIGLIYRGDSFVSVDWTNNYRTALLEYALGVVNGSGANKADNNSQKDWIGRLAFTLPVEYNSWLRQLKLGVSYYQGYNNLVNSTSNAVVQVGQSKRKGFDINWTHLPYSLAYEYAQGEDESLVGSAASATNTSPLFVKKSRGQYVNFGYTWGEQFLASEKSLAKYDDYWPKTWQAFFRYDRFDNDTRATSVGDKTSIATLGLNAFFAETTKLQLNYLVTRNDRPGSGYTQDRPRKINAISAQVQYGF